MRHVTSNYRMRCVLFRLLFILEVCRVSIQVFIVYPNNYLAFAKEEICDCSTIHSHEFLATSLKHVNGT